MSQGTMKNGAAEIRLNGAVLSADPSGALLWPERRTLVVADLHLEKGSAFAARGQLLPPYDTPAKRKIILEVSIKKIGFNFEMCRWGLATLPENS